jgi:transglutaminase-like putative cysteine protease
MSLFKSLAFCLVFGHAAFAGDPKYPVSSIPAELREKAHAVKRAEELNVEVTSGGDVITTHHFVVTILDANADDHSRVVEYYDNFSDIRSIKGTLYDAQGNEVRRLKQSEVQDLSAVDDGSLMTDGRMKVHCFYHKIYPYTIEYEIEEKRHSSFFISPWIPQEDEEYGVESSKLVVNAPEEFKVRYHNFNYKAEPVITKDKNGQTFTWEVKNMQPLPDESYVQEWYLRTTAVFLAPSAFELQRYKGTMNTWAELSSFIYTLNKDRDQLPDAIKQTVHQLTDGLSRDEKISKLYRYLQEHTRYISIQLGIGGWQTFDAKYVATKGYGDCKALSNYMCALLKEAGVPASCVLVHAGEGRMTLREEFPSNQFNHMIVCVPGAKDTTWLECTSRTLPAGYLSGFTADRPVLIVSEQGSKLVRTPAYKMEQNLQLRHISASVDENGDMVVNASTHYMGLQQDDLWDKLHALSREKLMESLKKEALLPSYDVNKYEWHAIPERLPAIDEQMELAAHNYATVSGKRMFIVPNLLNKSTRRPDAQEGRISAISLRFPYRDVDSVEIKVPAGYRPEAMPQPVSLQSEFGTYSAAVKVEGDVITYIRTMDHKSGTFPAGSYAALASFYNAVYKADRARIVLVKN